MKLLKSCAALTMHAWINCSHQMTLAASKRVHLSWLDLVDARGSLQVSAKNSVQFSTGSTGQDKNLQISSSKNQVIAWGKIPEVLCLGRGIRWFPFLQVHLVSRLRPSLRYTDSQAGLAGPAYSAAVDSPEIWQRSTALKLFQHTDSHRHTKQSYIKYKEIISL